MLVSHLQPKQRTAHEQSICISHNKYGMIASKTRVNQYLSAIQKIPSSYDTPIISIHWSNEYSIYSLQYCPENSYAFAPVDMKWQIGSVSLDGIPVENGCEVEPWMSHGDIAINIKQTILVWIVFHGNKLSCWMLILVYCCVLMF